MNTIAPAKKLLVVIAIVFLSFTVTVYAGEPESNSQDKQVFSYLGIEDCLRLTMSMTQSEFQGESQNALRGVFDYYVTDFWSFSGVMHFTLNRVKEMHRHMGAFGMNLHLFQIGYFEFFIGGNAGFTMVDHLYLPKEYVPTVEMLAGCTLFGEFFCLTGEYIYRQGGYYAANEKIYISLNEKVISLGIGFKLQF